MSVAGHWYECTDKAGGEKFRAIRITEPNHFVTQVHGRMPVVLDAKYFQPWQQGGVKDAAALMKPASADLLV
jgi:putative SOS response-associated peptidase YedK